MTKYVITNEEAKASVLKILGGIPVPFELVISDKRTRTLEQNALLHKWVEELTEQRGDVESGDVKAEIKLRFGIPILRRDEPKFKETYDRLLKPISYEEKIELIRYMGLPVTSVMSVKQLTELLETAERYYTSKGFTLTAGVDQQRR